MTAQRIAPLDPPYEPGVQKLLDKWMTAGNGEVEPLRLFRTFAVHHELFSRMGPLGAGILAHGRVEPRLREVMIHRTCVLNGAEYEWGVHAVIYGRPLGFTDAHLASTVNGSAADPVWSPAEAAVFRLADELHAGSEVSDDLYAELAAHFAADQILELTITAGWYRTISYVINTAGVRHEDWAERFPVL